MKNIKGGLGVRKQKSDRLVASVDIILPIFNEHRNIPRIYEEICNSFNDSIESIRIICIDDGSIDNSWQAINQLPKSRFLKKRTRIKGGKRTRVMVSGIKLTKNFGQFIAIEEGLKVSTADYVIIMDCDLQHPPKVALDLWNSRLSAPTIGTRQITRQDKIIKSLLSTSFYIFLQIVSGKKFPRNVSDFRIMDKETKNTILATSSSVKVPRFIIVSEGIQQKLLDYAPLKREAGESRYNLRSMLTLAGYVVLGSSSRLLRFGLLSALIYSIFIMALFIYIVTLVVTANFAAGWVSLMGTILFSFMLNFVLLGILGSYFAEYLSNLGKYTNRIKESNY